MGYGFEDASDMGYDYDLGEIPADYAPDPYAGELELEAALLDMEDEEFLVNCTDYEDFF